MDLKEVLKFIENNGPVAIGEVGLDLHHGKKIEKDIGWNNYLDGEVGKKSKESIA